MLFILFIWRKFMLNNTLYRLQHDKKLTVGYFGGSITEGAGASKPEFCWRSLTTAWFRETFPDCEIDAIQGAIGGTGSSLGIFRMENDLLSKNPDLVFIEFSVNDGCGDFFEISANSETLVRKIYTHNPNAEIIYVHTTTKALSDIVAAGGEITARTAHSTVMHYYGIPQIDMGEILRARIASEGGDWLQYTTDNVHPKDNGYAIYSDAVKAFLAKQLSDQTAGKPAPKVLPTPLWSDARINARLEDAKICADEDWTFVADKTLCGRYPHYIDADKPGAALEFRFTGKRVGVYMMLAKDSGDFLFSVDDGEEQTVRTWDTYCPRFNRAGGRLLSDELPYGEHVLKIRVSDTKAEESEGHAIRFGAFMVY